MQPKTLIGTAALLTSATAHAHPGHPALFAEHGHGFFGIDPAYALLATLVVAVAGLAWRLVRTRARGDRRR